MKVLHIKLIINNVCGYLRLLRKSAGNFLTQEPTKKKNKRTQEILITLRFWQSKRNQEHNESFQIRRSIGKDAAAVKMGQILSQFKNEKIIVVISAMGKMTNARESDKLINKSADLRDL